MANSEQQESAPPLVEKVVAYITKGDCLLVFRHVREDAGLQVPAGTLESGESPADGCLREAREETGLHGLELRRFLGRRDYDMSKYGLAETHRRQYYHLECMDDAPEVWRHFEDDPSRGPCERIEFELYWAKLGDDTPALTASQGDFIPELMASLSSAQ